MAAVVPIISALAAVASAGTGIASAAGAFSGPSAPKTTPMVPKGPDVQQITKSLIPGAKADTASRVGGGMSPDFLAGILGQQSGVPGSGLDVLGDIRRSLGQGGGIEAP